MGRYSLFGPPSAWVGLSGSAKLSPEWAGDRIPKGRRRFPVLKRSERKKAKLSSLQIIALGFFVIILVGTFLLMLPFST